MSSAPSTTFSVTFSDVGLMTRAHTPRCLSLRSIAIILSTPWTSTDGTASQWKYVIDNVIVYRDVYRGSGPNIALDQGQRGGPSGAVNLKRASVLWFQYVWHASVLSL